MCIGTDSSCQLVYYYFMYPVITLISVSGKVRNVTVQYIFMLSRSPIILRKYVYIYSTAHIQVYRKCFVPQENFEDNSRVGLMQHKEYTAHERLLTSWKYLRITPVLHLVLMSYSWWVVNTDEQILSCTWYSLATHVLCLMLISRTVDTWSC